MQPKVSLLALDYKSLSKNGSISIIYVISFINEYRRLDLDETLSFLDLSRLKKSIIATTSEYYYIPHI